MVDLFTTQRGRRGGGRDGCGGLHRGFCFKILLRQSLVGIFPIRLSSKHTEDLGAFLEGSQPPWVMALSSTQGTQEAREDKTLWSTIVAHFFLRTLDWQRRPSWTFLSTRSPPLLLAFLHKWQMGFQLFFIFIWPSFYSRGFCNGLRLHVKFFFCRMGLFTFSRGLPSTPSALYLFSPGHVVYTGKALDLAGRLSYPGLFDFTWILERSVASLI